MEYINKQQVVDKLATISCAISDIKGLKPDFSGDFCIICGQDVRKDDKYYDLNGATICNCCMRTKATINNKR